MDEFIKQGHWWWLLVVPVATGVFALGGSWLGAWLGRATEHKQWIRDNKQKAYTRFLSATTDAASNAFRADRKYAEEVMLALDEVRLCGSAGVLKAAEKIKAQVLLNNRIAKDRPFMLTEPDANEEGLKRTERELSKGIVDLLKLGDTFTKEARKDTGTATN